MSKRKTAKDNLGQDMGWMLKELKFFFVLYCGKNIRFDPRDLHF